MQSRKETAWKKNRKFGDVKGGRKRPRIADGIFARAHSLQRPHEAAELPIFVCDNPSRDFAFPIGEGEIRWELKHLPRKDWKKITRFWFRRLKKSEYEANELPLAEYARGSGVQFVILYAFPIAGARPHRWPKNMIR